MNKIYHAEGLASEHGFKTGDVILDVGGNAEVILRSHGRDSQPLFACRAREDRRHQLRRGLTGACPLASELAVDGRRKRNIGDDE